VVAGTVAVEQISVSMVVAGDVSSFDQEAFKQTLSSQLTGVEASDITLTVTSASISVTAYFSVPPSAPTASNMARLSEIASNATFASAVLGVQVESVSQPAVVTVVFPVPSPPPGVPPAPPLADSAGAKQTGGGSSDDNTTVIIVVVAVVVVLLAAGVGFMLYRKSQTASSTSSTKGVVMVESAMSPLDTVSQKEERL
jgi:hypothetical protein